MTLRRLARELSLFRLKRSVLLGLKSLWMHRLRSLLTAMGIDSDLAHASLRLTVGKDTSAPQIDRVLETLPAIVERLRSLAGNP